MLGVATIITVMSVMNGFRTELLSKILGFSGHATIVSADRAPIADFAALSAKLAEIPGVTLVIPFVEGRNIAADWPGARLHATRGLGHNRILRDAEVVRLAVEFIGE